MKRSITNSEELISLHRMSWTDGHGRTHVDPVSLLIHHREFLRKLVTKKDGTVLQVRKLDIDPPYVHTYTK